MMPFATFGLNSLTPPPANGFDAAALEAAALAKGLEAKGFEAAAVAGAA